MVVFIVCSTAVAAGLTVAYEMGRVSEKRSSGSSKDALPFQGFDWQSEDAKTAAKVFCAFFLVEVLFLPKSFNPFAYIADGKSFGGLTSILAFLVFGSWSALLAVGYGGVAASFHVLNSERTAFESAKSEHEQSFIKAESKLKKEEEKIEKEKRNNLASAAAVAGEWKKFHLTKEGDHSVRGRSINEKLWSKEIVKEFDKKTMHVVENATDMRWREIDDQDLTLEAIRLRNKEKKEKIKEKRAQRAKQENSGKDTLVNEKSKLIKLTGELESLKSNMDRLKEENMKKEQARIEKLKNHEKALREKERDLEKFHSQNLEKLRLQQEALKEREEKFDSGEEHRQMEELKKKMESSKLNVAKFNEEVMIKERQKLQEFRKRERELKKREAELTKMEREKGLKDMPDYSKFYKESGPEDELISIGSTGISVRLSPDQETEPSRDETDSSMKDLSTICEDTAGEDVQLKGSKCEEKNLSTQNKTADNNITTKSPNKPTNKTQKEGNEAIAERAPNSMTGVEKEEKVDAPSPDSKDKPVPDSTIKKSEEASRFIKKCGSDKSSIFDFGDDDEVSKTSTCMLNTIHNRTAVVKANKNTVKKNTTDANYPLVTNQSTMESDSDGDSLSHRIQKDMAAKGKQKSLTINCSHADTRHEQAAEYVSPVSSPLSERHGNAMRQKSPMSKAGSHASFDDIITMTSYNCASPKTSPRKSSKGNKSFVMTEEFSVDGMSWNEPRGMFQCY